MKLNLGCGKEVEEGRKKNEVKKNTSEGWDEYIDEIIMSHFY